MIQLDLGRVKWSAFFDHNSVRIYCIYTSVYICVNTCIIINHHNLKALGLLYNTCSSVSVITTYQRHITYTARFGAKLHFTLMMSVCRNHCIIHWPLATRYVTSSSDTTTFSPQGPARSSAPVRTAFRHHCSLIHHFGKACDAVLFMTNMNTLPGNKVPKTKTLSRNTPIQ